MCPTLAYPECPCLPEALASLALASRSGRPRLASLSLCVSATISEPADASLDGKGHPHPASALRRPQRSSHVQRLLGASSAHAFVVAVLCASTE
ncbi:UNVERIFIED_CONTAM: hypothetical protein Sradi_1587500 [Sesamum radiatum]|uniref:Uncharacterized protein n=1 Tax=Sesamum radiatum TaxID=300843 RepID=A0AAW2UAL9_SESRA